MLYARVVLGLPVEGPFDYIVPESLHQKISVGIRAWVPFRNKRKLGYVVGITDKTNIKNLKKISQIIDNYPILNKNMLSLTKEVSRYYCCTFGEAIETALPEGLRKGKEIQVDESKFPKLDILKGLKASPPTKVTTTTTTKPTGLAALLGWLFGLLTGRG